jgi:hypothetical protein
VVHRLRRSIERGCAYRTENANHIYEADGPNARHFHPVCILSTIGFRAVRSPAPRGALLAFVPRREPLRPGVNVPEFLLNASCIVRQAWDPIENPVACLVIGNFYNNPEFKKYLRS